MRLHESLQDVEQMVNAQHRLKIACLHIYVQHHRHCKMKNIAAQAAQFFSFVSVKEQLELVLFF